jgi:MFS family permease
MVRSVLPDYPRETSVVVGLISGSHVVNHTYLVLFPPVLGVLATEFDVGLAALGGAIGVQAFVNTAFQLPYGYLADTYDRTLTLGMALGIGGLGVLVLAVAPTFEWLLVGQAIVGLGISGHHAAHYPLLSDAAPAGSRGRIFSVHGFAGNVGFAAPPVVVVAITSLPGTSWRHAFGVMGLFGLAYAACAVYVLRRHVPAGIRRPVPAETPDGARTALAGRVRSELRSLRRSPAVLSVGLLMLTASTVVWGVSTYVVQFLQEGYGVAPDVASLALTAMFLTGAVLILPGGVLTDKYGPGRVMVGGFAVSAVFVFGLSSLVLPPGGAIVAAVFGGSFCSFTVPARDKLTDLLSDRGDLGRNFAIATIGYMVSQTVTPPLFGAIIETVSFGAAFAGIGAVGLLTIGMTLAIVVRWREDFAMAAA